MKFAYLLEKLNGYNSRLIQRYSKRYYGVGRKRPRNPERAVDTFIYILKGWSKKGTLFRRKRGQLHPAFYKQGKKITTFLFLSYGVLAIHVG